jgi:hypothetical protein
VPSDQWILVASIGAKSIVAAGSVGAAFDETCRHDAAGIGHGTPSQSSQWLQGALAPLRSVAGLPDGTAADATVMNPLARTARQARTAARRQKAFIDVILRPIVASANHVDVTGRWASGWCGEHKI